MPRSFAYPTHSPYPGEIEKLTITGRFPDGREHTMTLDLTPRSFTFTMPDPTKGEMPMVASIDMFGAIQWLGNTLEAAMSTADILKWLMSPDDIAKVVSQLIQEESEDGDKSR